MECGTTIYSHRHRWVLIIYLSWNIEENSVHLVKITVPFETNIGKANDRKHKKYLDLVSDITDNRFIFDLTCFEVGSRGLITPENIGYIAKIFFVGARPRTFLGNSATWLSCPATQSGMLDRSRLGLRKPAPDFCLIAVLAFPFAASPECLLLLHSCLFHFLGPHLFIFLGFVIICLLSIALRWFWYHLYCPVYGLSLCVLPWACVSFLYNIANAFLPDAKLLLPFVNAFF